MFVFSSITWFILALPDIRRRSKWDTFQSLGFCPRHTTLPQNSQRCKHIGCKYLPPLGFRFFFMDCIDYNIQIHFQSFVCLLWGPAAVKTLQSTRHTAVSVNGLFSCNANENQSWKAFLYLMSLKCHCWTTIAFHFDGR